MARTAPPPPTADPRLAALEAENLALRERLAGGPAEEMDLRLLRLNEELRREAEGLSREVAAMAHQNIELAFGIEEAEATLASVRAEVEEARARHEALEAELRAAREDVRQGDGARQVERLQAAIAATEERLAAEMASRGEADERMAVLFGRLSEAEGLLASSEASRAEADGQAATLRARLQELEGRLAGEEASRAEAGDLAARLAAVEEEKARLEGDLDRARGERQGLVAEVARLGGERSAAEEETRRELDLLRSEHQALRDLWARAEEELASLRPLAAEVASLRSELEAARARAQEVPDLEAALARVRSENAGMKAREAQVEQILRRSGDAEAELEEAHRRIRRLEATLADLKREAVERSLPSFTPPAGGEDGPARGLRAAVAEVLGPTGRVLVDRVYARCGVSPDSEAPRDLDRVLRGVAEAAARLVRSEEQRIRLAARLEEYRAGLGEGAAPKADEPRPDADLPASVAEAMKLLGLEKYEESLDRFVALDSRFPNTPEVRLGLFYNYVGTGCWTDAWRVGRPLAREASHGPEADRFVPAMATVVTELLSGVTDRQERRELVGVLAEMRRERNGTVR